MKTKITSKDLAKHLKKIINVANNLNVYEHPLDQEDVLEAEKILKKWDKQNPK